MNKYDIDGLMKAFPESKLKPARAESYDNPKLDEFLRFGTMEQLVEVVLRKQIPEPWRTLAIDKVPLQQIVVGVYDRLGGER